MKILGKLAAAAVLALTAASAPAVTFTATPAEAAPPWYAAQTYWLGGVQMGSTRYYCDGRVIDSGNVWDWDSTTWDEYYECP